jgi:hypothetical protein
MLTEKQVLFYQTFGFLVLRRLFSPDEVETINRELIRRLDTVYHDRPFDGTMRHGAAMMGPDTPFFATLLEDQRFLGAARQLYGDDVIASGLSGNRYVGNSDWHPDVDATHPGGPKFAIYLEPVGADSGALRVIPGSHRSPFHDRLREDLGMHMEKAGFDIPELPAFMCESQPGDVVVFDLRLWHASWGGASDRRMCTVEYLKHPRSPAEQQTIRDIARNTVRDPDWQVYAQTSPARQASLDRLRELAAG